MLPPPPTLHLLLPNKRSRKYSHFLFYSFILLLFFETTSPHCTLLCKHATLACTACACAPHDEYQCTHLLL